MKVADLLKNRTECGFSFEILPPLKGRGIVQIYDAILYGNSLHCISILQLIEASISLKAMPTGLTNEFPNA